MDSHPKALPAPAHGGSSLAPTTQGPRTDIHYHLHEWSSGTRGGGKVPADFGWRTNPKQWQEENGANRPEGGVAEALTPPKSL